MRRKNFFSRSLSLSHANFVRELLSVEEKRFCYGIEESKGRKE